MKYLTAKKSVNFTHCPEVGQLCTHTRIHAASPYTVPDHWPGSESSNVEVAFNNSLWHLTLKLGRRHHQNVVCGVNVFPKIFILSSYTVQIYSLILFIPSIFLTSHFKGWQYVTLKDLFSLTEINGIDFLGNWNLQQHLTVIHLIILMAEKETVPKLDPCEWRSN